MTKPALTDLHPLVRAVVEAAIQSVRPWDAGYWDGYNQAILSLRVAARALVAAMEEESDEG